MTRPVAEAPAGEPADDAAARRRDGRHGYDDLEPELCRHAAAVPGEPGYRQRRDRLIRAFLPLVHNLARRYGIEDNAEDIEQAGAMGLIKAIDRYDPGRSPGGPLAYLVPSVRGEMKRHMRDRTWTLRVPRGLKDLAVAVNQASIELSQQLGRSPRVSELAAHLDVPPEDVADALGALESYQAVSLDEPDPMSGTPLHERLGTWDESFDLAETAGELRRALGELSDRDRAVLLMRFWGNRTQSEIGLEIGVSQMHVSRLLSRSLGRLRELLAESPADAGRGRQGTG